VADAEVSDVQGFLADRFYFNTYVNEF